MSPDSQLPPPFRISQRTYRCMGTKKANGGIIRKWKWLYTCAVNCIKAPSITFMPGGGGCEKWAVDLAGYSFNKYPEARVRAYPVHHVNLIFG